MFLPIVQKGKCCRLPVILAFAILPVLVLVLTVHAEDVPAKAEAQKNISAWVISPRVCRTCKTESTWGSFLKFFPQVKTEFLDEENPKAKALIKELKIAMLPAYIISKDIEGVPNFAQVKGLLVPAADKYLLNPSESGVSYFLNRSVEPGRLDFFIFWTQKEAYPILKMVEGLIQVKQSRKQFNLQFVGRKDPKSGELVSPAGPRDIQEGTVYACLESHYPKESWKYLECRLGNMENMYWDDCLDPKEVKKEAVVQCARGEEGKKLYEAKTKLSQDLGINYAPLFLLDDVEVFGVTAQSTVSDIMSVIGN